MTPPLWIVATDLTSSSDGACNEAARLAAATGASLTLLYAQPIEIVLNEFATGAVTTAQHEAIRNDLSAVRDKLNKNYPDLNIDIHVVDGAPTAAIVDEAERLGAAHVVVGTHGRTGISHLVLGSVAESVVRRCPVPVTVVRPQ